MRMSKFEFHKSSYFSNEREMKPYLEFIVK